MRTRFIPVVILTASRQQEDVLAGYEGGANAYVRKPVKFAEFADAVNTLGLFWLLLNEPAPDVTTTQSSPPTECGAIGRWIRRRRLALRREARHDHVDGALGAVGREGLAPHDRAQEQRAEEQVVHEREVGVGFQLAALDAPAEHLEDDFAAGTQVFLLVGLGELGVGGEIGDEPGGDAAAAGCAHQRRPDGVGSRRGRRAACPCRPPGWRSGWSRPGRPRPAPPWTPSAGRWWAGRHRRSPRSARS